MIVPVNLQQNIKSTLKIALMKYRYGLYEDSGLLCSLCLSLDPTLKAAMKLKILNAIRLGEPEFCLPEMTNFFRLDRRVVENLADMGDDWLMQRVMELYHGEPARKAAS